MDKWRKSTKRRIQWKRPNRRKIFQFVDIKLEKKKFHNDWNVEFN